MCVLLYRVGKKMSKYKLEVRREKVVTNEKVEERR
jgi:hypothetical protein